MKNRNFIKKILSLAGFFAAAVFAATIGSLHIAPLVAFAQAKISLTLPGSYVITTSTPPGYVIANFYQFALIIGGLLAFGAIVYGGIKYSTSAGNPSGQHEGREWIESALLGLLLLAGAFLILNTVNPALTHLDLPTLQQVNIATPPQSAGGGPSGTGCATGQCEVAPNCTPIPGKVNCGAAPEMVATLQCIQGKDPNYNVTEGYPPTNSTGHISQCHSNGCCVDTVVPGGGCDAVNALISAAQQCGATVANEYTSCGGQTYGTTNGSNVHITSQHTNGC